MPAFTVGFVLFPDLTQLDLTGPLQVLARFRAGQFGPDPLARNDDTRRNSCA
jgi:hypothetical protein